MPLDPFAALGIEAPTSPPPSAMIPGQDMPTMRVTPQKGGVNPFAALGIDDSVSYPATAARQVAPVGRGVAANFAAGANQSIMGALGAPVDLASGAMHLLERGRAATSGIPSPWGTPDQEPVGGSSWIKRQFGRVSANPDDVQPVNEAERMAQGAGGAVAQVPLMAMGGAAVSGAPGLVGGVGRSLARAGVETVPQTALTAAATGIGGAAGQAAEDAAPDALKPYANIAGNLAGAAGTIGAVAGARAGTNLIVRKAGEAGIGRKTDIGGMRATGAQINAAGNQVESALGPEGRQLLERTAATEKEATELEAKVSDPTATPDEQAAAQSRLRQIQSQRMNLVPGAEPTTAQVAQTPSAAAFEKVHRVATPEPFLQRAQDQNVARVASINAVQPEGNAASVGQMFTDHLNALEAAGQQRIAGASGAVSGATERLGGQQAPAAIGEAMRGGLEANNKVLQGRERTLWQAIDPEGKLALSVRPVRDAAKTLLSEINPAVGDSLTEHEAFLPAVANGPDVISFTDLSKLRGNIGDAQRTLGPKLGFDSRPMRRLGILKNAVDESIARAVDEQVSRNPDLAGRVQSEIQQYGEVTGRSPGRANPADSGGVASGLPGASGAPGAGNAGRGNAAGGDAIPPLAANGRVGRAPETLVDFLISRGGVRDQGGDLAAQGLDTVHHRAAGRLINRRGLTLDYAREAAVQEGFLPPNADINDLRNALGEHASGRPTYRIHEAADAALRQQDVRQTALQEEATRRAQAAVSGFEGDAGLRLTQAEHDHATRLVMEDRLHPEDAVRQAIMHGDESVLQRNAERSAFGMGVPLSAHQSEMGVGGGAPALTPNFDQTAADRYAAARQSTLERKSTYRQGPVGAVLRSGPGGAEFAVADSDVARKFFSGGAREPADVQRFISAAGGQPEALQAAREYLANDMRARGITHPDGTIDLAKFAGWQRTHSRTIDLFPGLREQISDATTAQRTLDDVRSAHTDAVKKFQDGVAKNFLGGDDPLIAVRKALSSGNPTQTFTDLARAVRGNAEAEAGLRRGVVDYILQRMSSVAPSGAGDVDFLNAATFQKWVRQYKGPMRALFGGQGSQSIEMVAADLRRQAQRTAATGGSDTAANLAAAKKTGVGAAAAHQVPMTVLTLIGEHLGAAAHGGLGGLVGAVALPALGSLGHSMRQAGINTTTGLAREAMLHPKLAVELVQRVADRNRISAVTQRRIGAALQAAIAADMAHSAQRKPAQ
jgi:hypothetical protein